MVRTPSDVINAGENGVNVCVSAMEQARQGEQPLELPSHLVYQGGAAPGAQCASCRATSTSGSWRRGWILSSGGHANMCNR